MNQSHHNSAGGKSEDTSPGVRMLKDVWRIGADRKIPEPPPESVETDIYKVPSHKTSIPRRHHRRNQP